MNDIWMLSCCGCWHCLLESCSMSLIKSSARGKTLRNHRLSWGSHLAFPLGFLELHSDEMKSQIEKGGQMAPKGSEGKKKKWAKWIIMFWSHACAFWTFEIHCLGWGKGVNSRPVVPLPRAGQACTLWAFIQNIVYLIILPLPTGMVSMAGVPWSWDAMNVYGARICHSCFPEKQHWWQWANSPMCIPAGTTPACAHDPMPSLPHSWEGVAQLWVTTGPEPSPDGCCHMFVSSRGFQAVRAIKDNWKSHI